MTDNNSIIDSLNAIIDKIDKKYRLGVDDIVADYKRENDIKKDYSRRQIYELMQNADDCYNEETPSVDIKFALKGNELIIQNTGSPFDENGVISLLYSNDSSKYVGTIGYKGLGFRSVLNWSSKISIYTKKFNIHFSKERAISELNNYKKIHANAERFDKLEKIDHVAILSRPIVDDKEELRNRYLEDGFATSIVLTCDEEFVDDIRKELSELQFEELLFLKHIASVKIELSPTEIRAIRAFKDSNTQECIIEEEGKESTTWKTWSKSGVLPGTSKNYELVIAKSNEEKVRNDNRQRGTLYSYFKTDTAMPFPFLVHGTFDLTSERNNLIKESKDNAKLLEILIDFIADTSLEIARNNPQSSYEALEFAIPSGRASFLNENYSFTKNLLEKIKHYKVFPSINDSYLSLDDNPYYYDNEFDELLNKTTFAKLLKKTNNDSIKRFLYSCGIGKYSYQDFCQMLVIDADEYISSKKNIKIIRLYNDAYKDAPYGPFLLVDSDGNRIADGDLKIFTSPTIEFTTPPSWGKMRFLNKELEKALSDEFDLNGRRSFIKELEKFNVVEYSFNKVAEELNRQSKDANTIKSYLKWLYENWSTRQVLYFESTMKPLDIDVLSRNGEVVSCSQCFLGKEYENDLGERLLTNSKNNISFLASKDDLGFGDINIPDFNNFLSELGLSRYPKIELIALSNEERKLFFQYNSKVFKEIQVEYSERYTSNEIERANFLNVQVEGIKGLNNILTESSFSDVICWLLNDKAAFEGLSSIQETSAKSKVSFKPRSKLNIRSFDRSHMLSWLRICFQDIKWIDAVSQIKTNVFNCLNENCSLSPIIEAIKIPYDEIRKALGGRRDRETDALFERLGVRPNIADLPKEKIYEILLELSEHNIPPEVTRRVYTSLNSGFDAKEVDKLIESNPKYEEFKDHGLVLCQVGSQYSYRPCNQVYYVDNKVMSNEAIKQHPTLALGKRCGKDKIQKLFCVKSIEDSIKVNIVEKKIHEKNTEFYDYYRKRLPYLYCARIGKDKNDAERDRLIGTQVILVGEATIEYTFGDKVTREKLGRYEAIMSGDDVAYIQAPASFNNLNDLFNITTFRFSLADMVTIITRVDGDRDFYANILSCKDISDIEELLSDDTVKLRLSKEKFDKLLDAEANFYVAIAAALKVTPEEIKQELSEKLVGFDFKNYDLEKIIALFKQLEIDANDFNEVAFYRVYLKEYWQNKFNELKNTCKEKYLIFKIKQLIEEGGHFKDEFNQIEVDYNFALVEFENSVNEDIAQKFEEIYGIKPSDLDSVEGSLNELKEQLLERPQESETAEQIEEHKEEKKEVDWAALFNEVADTCTGEVLDVNTSSETQEESGEGHAKGGKNRGKKYETSSNETKERNGFVAESMVYRTLVTKLGNPNNVVWISGNGLKAGKISADRCDDGAGYDIQYTDENGIHYAEVKGRQGPNIEFNLSKNEYEFGDANKERFELWFVPIRDDGTAKAPINLKNIFLFDDGQSFFHNDKFSVEQNEFKIRAKIVPDDSSESEQE